MSQKVNPIAVRLRLNRLSDSSWFSDYYYSKLLYHDINFREYLSSIKQPTANKLGFRPGKCIVHLYPKKSMIHLFCVGRAGGELRSQSIIKKKLQQSSRPWSPIGKTYLSQRVPAGVEKNKKAIASYIRQAYNSYKQAFTIMGAIHFQLNHKTNLYKNLTPIAARSFGSYPADPLTQAEPVSQPLFIRNLLKLYTRKDTREQIRLNRIRINQTNSQVLFRYLLFIMFGLTGSILKPDAFACHSVAFDNRTVATSLSSEILLNYLAMYYFLFSNTNTLYGAILNQRVVLCNQRSLSWFVTEGSNVVGSSLKCLNTTGSRSDRIDRQLKPLDEWAQPVFSNLVTAPEAVLLKSRSFYLSNLQSIFTDKTNTATHLRIIKVASIYQSAYLIAQEISCKLEQKKSFRQICRSVFQQISICKYIKGIRISCSGRINGAEIAKTECRKYGETSLHVFSDKIDYAQAKASTPYGILGVKVWISYV